MVFVKGFGGFMLVSLLLSAFLFQCYFFHSAGLVDLYSEVKEIRQYGWIGFLRNVILKSHMQLGGVDDAHWRLFVAGWLAEEYGLQVILDGERVRISDGVGSFTEFYLVE